MNDWPVLAELEARLEVLANTTVTVPVQQQPTPDASPGDGGDANRGRQTYLDLQAYMNRTGRTLR